MATTSLAPDRLLLVPRWSGHPDSDFYPWLRQQVVELGFRGTVEAVPLRPPEAPDLAATVAAVREHLGVGDTAQRTVLMGHSVGAQAVLRAVAELPDGDHVDAVLLVAGWWTVDQPWPTIVPWIEAPFEWARVRTAARRRLVLLSDDDPFTADAARTQGTFETRIAAEVRIQAGAKHFNATEEPAVLEAVGELLGLHQVDR